MRPQTHLPTLVSFEVSALLVLGLATSTAFAEPQTRSLDLPWRQAGLDERQAAAHLLDRLAYGPRPGDVDRVVAVGVERWLESQLTASLADPKLEGKLDRFETLDLSTQEIGEKFVGRGVILRRAVEAGVIEQDAIDPSRPDRLAPADQKTLREWARRQGFGSQRVATGELMAHKLVRARYAENQLQEVMTDFWFNHFNVSVTKPRTRIYVWPYERDAVRPHVLGNFYDMLEATAKHPAMLHYLDNVRSVAEAEQTTTLDRRLRDRGRDRDRRRRRSRQRAPERERAGGLNENYARELMELHTLGVDGGYDQKDVVDVARAFTGWTAYPPEGRRPDIRRRIAQARRYPEAGFVIEQAFIFRADAHDAGEKLVLGQRLPAGRGIEDGLQVLEMLAAHPSTARHLAGKLATRFVSDQPPAALVDRLAEEFQNTGGDLRRVVVALVESPEFWSEQALGAKIKSPFELAISALRALGAEITDPRQALEWISRMGQPLYAYAAPTGYPDKAEAWVNTGALLHRMNFGLQLATGRIGGLRLDLEGLIEGREPESLGHALRSYLPVLLPERDPAVSMARLEAVIHDPRLASKIESSAPASEAREGDVAAMDDWDVSSAGRRRGRRAAPPPTDIDDSPVAHVVGVILGSPEFQRR